MAQPPMSNAPNANFIAYRLSLIAFCTFSVYISFSLNTLNVDNANVALFASKSNHTPRWSYPYSTCWDRGNSKLHRTRPSNLNGFSSLKMTPFYFFIQWNIQIFAFNITCFLVEYDDLFRIPFKIRSNTQNCSLIAFKCNRRSFSFLLVFL